MEPSSASSPGSEDSTSLSNTSGSDASDRSNGTQDAPLFSSDTGPASNDGETLLPTPTSQAAKHGSTRDVTANGHGYNLWDVPHLISSSEASPASPSVSPADGKESMTSDTSGPSSVASSTRLDPPWSSSRTFLVCSLSDGQWTTEQAALFGNQLLATFSGTWPRWGSMRDGQVFEHPTPERRTVESGSGSLHTPTTGDTSPSFDHRASPGYTRDKPVPNLAAQVDELIPTATARDHKGARPEPRTPGDLLPDVVQDLLPTAKTPTGGSEKRGPRKARGSGGEDLEARISTIASLGDPTNQLSADGNE